MRTKRPGHAPKTADFGHTRGEYYVFPARVVQKPWPQQTPGHNKAATIMAMSITGYARVSTADQDPTSQIEALRAAGCDPIYIEHASGATMERSQWSECNRGLGRGDTLVVVRIDRLGRSLADLVSTLDDLGTRGVHFRSLTEGIDTSTALGECSTNSRVRSRSMSEPSSANARAPASTQPAPPAGGSVGRRHSQKNRKPAPDNSVPRGTASQPQQES